MNIKKLRKDMGKSQQEVANILNIALSTYRGYENETSEPAIEIMFKLADFFDVSLDYLCGRTWNNSIGHIQEDRRNSVKQLTELSDDNFLKVKEFIDFLHNKNSTN